MIYGFNTLASVALRIAEDFNHYGRGGYSYDQAIEKVCWRKETLARDQYSPSYIWWSFEIVGGDTSVSYDKGCLAEIPYSDTSYRFVPARNLETGENLIPDFNYQGLDALALELGLGIGQRVLTRYMEHYSVDYWGEHDCKVDAEIIYAEDHGPFPLCIDTGLERRPRMRSMRVQ